MWKDIKGYEGRYFISDDGKVKNGKGDILSPYTTRKGYLRIGLYKEGKAKNFLVHRLVAEAYIDNPMNFKEVNHIDLNKKNNHVKNLEWVDGSKNVQHAVKNIEGRKEHIQETMSEVGKKYNHIGVEASKKPVAQINRDTGQVIAIYESAREASRKTGSNYKNISQVCNGKRKTHNGYRWSFVK